MGEEGLININYLVAKSGFQRRRGALSLGKEVVWLQSKSLETRPSFLPLVLLPRPLICLKIPKPFLQVPKEDLGSVWLGENKMTPEHIFCLQVPWAMGFLHTWEAHFGCIPVCDTMRKTRWTHPKM